MPGRIRSTGRARTASVQRVETAPIAAGSLIAGYAVAVESGIRPLGGGVLLAGTAWCAREWRRRNGLLAAVALVGVQGVAFVASHRLAPRIGAWSSVIAVAAASGAAAATADRAAANPSESQARRSRGRTARLAPRRR